MKILKSVPEKRTIFVLASIVYVVGPNRLKLSLEGS